MNTTEKGVTFLRRILIDRGGVTFLCRKMTLGQYSTGVTSLSYTGL
jgi:hypothetical protein